MNREIITWGRAMHLYFGTPVYDNRVSQIYESGRARLMLISSWRGVRSLCEMDRNRYIPPRQRDHILGVEDQPSFWCFGFIVWGIRVRLSKPHRHLAMTHTRKKSGEPCGTLCAHSLLNCRGWALRGELMWISVRVLNGVFTVRWTHKSLKLKLWQFNRFSWIITWIMTVWSNHFLIFRGYDEHDPSGYISKLMIMYRISTVSEFQIIRKNILTDG
jgi:hypothetical protein